MESCMWCDMGIIGSDMGTMWVVPIKDEGDENAHFYHLKCYVDCYADDNNASRRKIGLEGIDLSNAYYATRK